MRRKRPFGTVKQADQVFGSQRMLVRRELLLMNGYLEISEKPPGNGRCWPLRNLHVRSESEIRSRFAPVPFHPQAWLLQDLLPSSVNWRWKSKKKKQ